MESRSLPSLVRSLSRIYGPKPAIVATDGDTSHELSWTEFWAGARSLSIDLLHNGLKAGESVAVASPDSIAALQAEIGIQAAGGCVIRAYPDVETGLLVDTIRETECNRAMACEELRGLVSSSYAGYDQRVDIGTLVDAIPTDPDLDSLDSFTDNPDLEARLDQVGPDSDAVTLLSGTDRVNLLQGDLIDGGVTVAQTLDASEMDVWLWSGPMYGPLSRMSGFCASLVSCGLFVLSSNSPINIEDLWTTRPSLINCTGNGLSTLHDRFVSEVESMSGPGGFMTRIALHALDDDSTGIKASIARAISLSRLRSVLGDRLRCIIDESSSTDVDSIHSLSSLGIDVFHADLGCDVPNVPNLTKLG